MTRPVLALVAALLLAACSTQSHVIVGKVRPPVPPDQVKLYLAPPKAFEKIAIVDASSQHSMTFTAQQKSDKAIARLKEEAGKLQRERRAARGDRQPDGRLRRHRPRLGEHVGQLVPGRRHRVLRERRGESRQRPRDLRHRGIIDTRRSGTPPRAGEPRHVAGGAYGRLRQRHGRGDGARHRESALRQSGVGDSIYYHRPYLRPPPCRPA